MGKGFKTKGSISKRFKITGTGRVRIKKLAGRSRRSSKAGVRLPTFRGDGLLPGLSLDDLATIYDRMDRHG